MSFGEKLSKLRKENNYTQEQLADVLNVSRQSVSKWESDLAYPETEKLIKISELFNCSLDYLMKENCDNNNSNSNNIKINSLLNLNIAERKSDKIVMGLPLYHIGKNAKGFIAIGLNAKGVISIGLLSRGIISLGLLSIGILSFGMLAIGLLVLGIFTLGIISGGCISVGFFAIGAISIGVISLGGISIGDFAIGGLAIGKYFAYGDSASGMISIGITDSYGEVLSVYSEISASDAINVRNALDEVVPNYFAWIKEIMKNFARI